MKKIHLVWRKGQYHILDKGGKPQATPTPFPPDGGDDFSGSSPTPELVFSTTKPTDTPDPIGTSEPTDTPEPTETPEPTATPEPSVKAVFLHEDNGFFKDAQLDGVMRIQATDKDKGDGWSYVREITHVKVQGLVERKGLDGWEVHASSIPREVSIVITGGTLTVDGDTAYIQGPKDRPISMELQDNKQVTDRVMVIYEGKVVLTQTGTPAPTPEATEFAFTEETWEATEAPHFDIPVADSKEISFIPWIVFGLSLLLCAAAGMLFFMSRRRRKQGTGRSTTLRYAALQNIGRRSGQQDSYDVVELEDGIIATVADGMGGLSDGDKVSRRIVQTVRQRWGALRVDQLFRKLPQMVMRINDEVNQMLGRDGLCKSGSTLIVALVRPDKFEWISVGDSRIYLYRGGSLMQLNREHDFESDLELFAVNHDLDFDEAYTHPKKRSVSSYIGMGRLKAIDTTRQSITAQLGDRLLLMSDGVFNALSSEEMANIITNYPDVHEAATVMESAVLARANPHQDNFTAVIIGFED